MALELAGDVADFILKKAAGKVVGEAVTKLQGRILGPSKNQEELEAIGEQLQSLKKDEDEIVNKLNTVLSMLKEEGAKKRADDAKFKITVARLSYHNYITDKIAGAKPHLTMPAFSDNVLAQLLDYHLALVDSAGLIQWTVSHYWDKYEKCGKDESFDHNILSVRNDLLEFMKHAFGIQLIGLNLMSMLTEDDKMRQQHIKHQSERFEDQFNTLKNNIPSCIHIYSDDWDADWNEFLTQSSFRLQWWTTGVINVKEYLSSGWLLWYKDWPWSDDTARVVPFLDWSTLDNPNIIKKNTKAQEWKFEKSGDFYYLVGYSVERYHPPDRSMGVGSSGIGSATLYPTPEEVNVRMESKSEGRIVNDSGNLGTVLAEAKAKDRYTARWHGENVLFKVILMRSKMKKSDGTFDNKHEPIVRIVDTKWWSRSNELSPMFNADTGDYYVHQLNKIK